GSIDPLTATMNQFNPVTMLATSIQNVRVASEVYGKDAGYMAEAQALGAVKGALPAIGAAVGSLVGPAGTAIGSAIGSALASTIHVDAKTGKRDYQTTDQTFISASVAAGLAGMNSGLLQNLVSAASAGIEYDANGNFTGKFNAGNAAIAFAGDYAGGQFNATHMSQYLARDITTQVLTAGKEYYNYSQGYENGYAAFANPDLTRLGSLAGGLSMSMQKDSREGRTLKILEDGKRDNKTDAEIEADLKLAGLDDVLNEIKARINQKANQTDQTNRMAQILQGFGVFRDLNVNSISIEGPIPDAARSVWDTLTTVLGHVADGAANLTKFGLGAALFLPMQAAIVGLGALTTVGHTLGLGMQIGESAGMGAGHAAAIGGLSAARIATTLAKYALGVPLALLLGVPSVIADAFDGRYGSDAENNPNAVTRFGNTVMDAYMGFFGGIESSIDGAIGATYDSMVASIKEPWTHERELARVKQVYDLLKGQKLSKEGLTENEDGLYVRNKSNFFTASGYRLELDADGKVKNYIVEEGRGILGTDRVYINGERLNDGDMFFRDLDMNMKVIADGPDGTIRQKLAEYKGKNYLITQNGVWNGGLGAIDLSDFTRRKVASTIGNYGGSMGVYNSTSVAGDLLNLGVSYALQAAGLPGTEAASGTWGKIFDSGIMDNGGLIVAHSQGAQIVTHALQTWKGKARNIDKRLGADLLLLGGAHTIKPIQAVNFTLDTRNRIDYMTGAFHWGGDGINGRPDNGERYQMVMDTNAGGLFRGEGWSLTFNHTAVETYGWALDDYVRHKGEFRDYVPVIVRL
ncbi:hypothetical protein, partial [Leptonema illini]